MCEVSLSPNTSCVSEECQDARDLHSNSTSPDKPDCGSAGTPDIIFYVYYYGFLLLLSLINMVGNGMIIHCVLRHRRLRVPGNYFIVSLACSDLILGIVYPIYNVSHMELGAIQRTLGVWGSCTVIITATLGMLNVSSYNLVGVTVTRYVAIRDPLKFASNMTHQRALISIAAVWGALITLACALYLRPTPSDGYQGLCRYELVLGSMPLHVFFTCIFSMVIPLIVMAALYIHMAIIARKQMRAIVSQEVAVRRSSKGHTRGSLLRRELKMFRMAGTLLGYFVLAWVPFVVFEFISVVNGHEVNKYVRATVRIILHSNSAVNAFIYAGRLKEFRDALNKEFPCCSGYHSRRLEPDVSCDARMPGEASLSMSEYRGRRDEDLVASRQTTAKENCEAISTISCRRRQEDQPTEDFPKWACLQLCKRKCTCSNCYLHEVKSVVTLPQNGSPHSLPVQEL